MGVGGRTDLASECARPWSPGPSPGLRLSGRPTQTEEELTCREWAEAHIQGSLDRAQLRLTSPAASPPGA